MRILPSNAHPDEGSLCDAVAATYIEGAQEGDHEVRAAQLRDLNFGLLLPGGFDPAKPLEPDIAQQQELIK